MENNICVEKRITTLLIVVAILSLAALFIAGNVSRNKTSTTANASIHKSPQKYIGGTTTTVTKWPFVVMIVWDHKVRLPSGEYDLIRARRCTGSIISKRWILTAAHCVGSDSDSDVGIVIGMDDIENQKIGVTPNIKYLRPKKVLKHKDYKVVAIKGKGIMAYADIALLNVDIDLVQQAIPLASQVNYKSTSAYGIGWGLFRSTTDTIELPKQLQELEVKPHKRGFEYFLMDTVSNTQFSDKVLVSYISPGQSIGAGDSGGPLVFLNTTTNLYELVGITSSGPQYTDVTKYTKWIADNMK